MSLWAFRLPIRARRHVAKPFEILSFDVWIDLQVEIDRFYVLVGQDNFVVILRDQSCHGEQPCDRRVKGLAEKQRPGGQRCLPLG